MICNYSIPPDEKIPKTRATVKSATEEREEKERMGEGARAKSRGTRNQRSTAETLGKREHSPSSIKQHIFLVLLTFSRLF
jgi:hypothetical protein